MAGKGYGGHRTDLATLVFVPFLLVYCLGLLAFFKWLTTLF